MIINFDPDNTIGELNENNNSYSFTFYINSEPAQPEADRHQESTPQNNQPSEIAKRLKGKLLLQVQDKGRIWYVNPINAKRHEVTFANALPLFEKVALGITNDDLNNIPYHNENRTSSIGDRLKGRLLLQVEDRGRIWYVDFNGKKWEVTWSNLMTLFQQLALGITDDNLNKIEIENL